MTLNAVMAVTLRYFTEFDKPALQKTMCGGIYARDLYCVGGSLSLTQSIYCIFSECTMSPQRKFTFAISSPDEFLVFPSEARSRLRLDRTWADVFKNVCHSRVKHFCLLLVVVSTQSRSTRCGRAHRNAAPARTFLYLAMSTTVTKTTSLRLSTVRSRATARVKTATISQRRRSAKAANRRWKDRRALQPRR